ncbi:MAG: type II toxin-antitoxin system RelE/ParE family toxin [Methanomicrobium sp.]|nr:type II toxin-antitoxin system RelE/ParE family toxin [Methanomicrobium sp.]
MSYKIILPENIQKSLNKLPKEIRERIVQKIYEIREDPFRYVIPVKGTDYHRLRVGYYRVIMRIENSRMIIIVVRVDNRSNVYKKI